MPKARSSIHLRETRKSGKAKGLLGVDSAKKFLISKVFKGAFGSTAFKYKMTLRLVRLQQLLLFKVRVTHIDNTLQKGRAGKYSDKGSRRL
jgi:hypothetical protein